MREKLLLSIKYVHIINIFFLNKKLYDEILSFLTKVVNLVLIPINIPLY